MTPLGKKLTPEQRKRLSNAHMGQKPWNIGKGGCKKGHDKSLYRPLPSGVYICFGCRHENTARYREKNRKKINLKNRVARYDIEISDFEDVYAAQFGRCAICGKELTAKKARIDHDHKNQRVRGLLCAACNTGLGLFKDSQDFLLSAIEYLRKNDTGE